MFMNLLGSPAFDRLHLAIALPVHSSASNWYLFWIFILKQEKNSVRDVFRNKKNCNWYVEILAARS